MTDEPNLTPAETTETGESPSASDLSRPARADEFRVQRRSQISTALPALMLIGLGIVYLAVDLTFIEKIAAAVGILGVSLILRFFLNGRREPGLFFIGMVTLLWLGFAASDPLFNVDLFQAWPLVISAVGLALLLTILVQRSREVRLALPAFLILLAGLVMLPFTMGLFIDEVLLTVASLWPLILVIPILLLIPRVIRRPTA
jgi:hypothetical protein